MEVAQLRGKGRLEDKNDKIIMVMERSIKLKMAYLLLVIALSGTP